MNSNAVKDASAPPVAEPKQDKLRARLLSALVMAPPVLAAIYFGEPFFDILVAIAVLIMAWEWNRLCSGRWIWLVAGGLFILLPSTALIWLRADPEFGRQTVLWLFAVVWAMDSGAFAFGKLIGGPKLLASVSPKKTWAGLIGGIACAGAVGAATAAVVGNKDMAPLAAFSAATGAVSQGGDLAESWVKRHFSVKDTSNIIPGHGGLLDRVDGLMAAAAAAALITLAGGGSILSWL